MYPPNEERVLARIGPDDVVLDVGGWACPFNRADYVLDVQPYETRGRCYGERYGRASQGGDERFSERTWVRRDICDHTPWPFADKAIDFCVCSHTLEDIRDPIWVCREMNRVARRGYLEVPSQLFEMTRGREPGVPVGLSHHRWIVEIDGPQVTFIAKHHFLHGDRRLSFPASFGDLLPPERRVSWLFWDDAFAYREGDLSRDDFAAIVRRHLPEGEPNDDRDLDQKRIEEVERLLFEIWQAREERDLARAERDEALARLAQAVAGAQPGGLLRPFLARLGATRSHGR